MPARTTVTFDGHSLSGMCHISNVQRPVPQRKATTMSVPGRDGSVLTGVSLQPLEVTMQLNFLQQDPADRMDAIEEVLAWLDVDEPKALAFSDQPGHYMAVPTTASNVTKRLTSTSVAAVKFYCPDPVRFGDSQSANVDSGTTTTIQVGGNFPTTLDISTMVAKKDSTTGLWEVTLDGSVSTATASIANTSSHAVVFDATNHLHTLDGAVKVVTLDSDWMEGIAPGSHTIGVTSGTGGFTVSWIERWL